MFVFDEEALRLNQYKMYRFDQVIEFVDFDYQLLSIDHQDKLLLMIANVFHLMLMHSHVFLNNLFQIDMLVDYEQVPVLVLSKLMVSLVMLHIHRLSIMVLNEIEIYENVNKNLQDPYVN